MESRATRAAWRYLLVFALLTVGGILLAGITHHRLIQIFESFYRYGFLVFGGGQVVAPVMHQNSVFRAS